MPSVPMQPGQPSERRKRLTDDECLRVVAKLRVIQQRTLLRPDMKPVFHYCDRLRISVLTGSIATDDVVRLKRLFDEHGIR